MKLCFCKLCFGFIGPVLLVFEFCSRGTLESNLRESEKNRQLCMKKTKISLINEIAKGMRHLADSRVRDCCMILKPHHLICCCMILKPDHLIWCIILKPVHQTCCIILKPVIL